MTETQIQSVIDNTVDAIDNLNALLNTASKEGICFEIAYTVGSVDAKDDITKTSMLKSIKTLNIKRVVKYERTHKNPLKQ